LCRTLASSDFSLAAVVIVVCALPCLQQAGAGRAVEQWSSGGANRHALPDENERVLKPLESQHVFVHCIYLVDFTYSEGIFLRCLNFSVRRPFEKCGLVWWARGGLVVVVVSVVYHRSLNIPVDLDRYGQYRSVNKSTSTGRSNGGEIYV